MNFNFEGEGGFDIAAPLSGSSDMTALAIYQKNKKSALFTIDLNTCKAKQVEKFEKQ